MLYLICMICLFFFSIVAVCVFGTSIEVDNELLVSKCFNALKICLIAMIVILFQKHGIAVELVNAIADLFRVV